MAASADHPVTELLIAWGAGDAGALERLTPLVYSELRKIARGYMARERPGQTLEPTALIHEAFLRLANMGPSAWQSRTQFFSLSAQIMRRILVDLARSKRYQKRGGHAHRVTLTEGLVPTARSRDLIALDDALHALAEVDGRKARIVEMRFFGGLTADETADVLGISSKTVLREWQTAKVWLLRELSTGDGARERR